MIGPPSDALSACLSDMLCAGWVVCWILGVQLVAISRGEIRGDPSHRHASDVTLQR